MRKQGLFWGGWLTVAGGYLLLYLAAQSDDHQLTVRLALDGMQVLMLGGALVVISLFIRD